MTPTIGILDWTRKEIEGLDIRSRNIMAMAGSLHVRSDVERLYVKRIYMSRTVSPVAHIINRKKGTNELLNKVYKHEKNNLVREASELKQSLTLKTKK